MPSKSLAHWRGQRARELDEIANAHRAVGGKGPGRRHATQQLNRAYAVLLASHFQGFCRDLHSECAGVVVLGVAPAVLQPLVSAGLTKGRRLDRANATPGSISEDFERLGLVAFWPTLAGRDSRTDARKISLERLNQWRNAIAHQSLDPTKLGGTILRLRDVRGWRRDCDGLASTFDASLYDHLLQLMGQPPW